MNSLTTFGGIEVIEIIIKKDAHYAHLRQTATIELSEGLLDQEPELLGFHSGLATRQLYYRIPARTSKEDLELLLDSYPRARIIRILDHEPVLTPGQHERVLKGVVSRAEIARNQLVKNHDGTAYIDVHGHAVYGQNRLNLTGQLDDQDHRWFQTLQGAEIEQEMLEPVLAEAFIPQTI